MRFTFPLLVTVLTTITCVPARFVYAPPPTTGAEIAGGATTPYVLPPDGPQGSVAVYLRSVGLHQLTESTQGWVASKWRGVHIALDVVNSSDVVWRVDPGEQRIELPGDDQPRVVDALPKSGVITIAPHTAHSIDVQFLLPTGLEHPRNLPALNVIWVVRAGTRVITRRTTFERFVAAP